MVHGFAGRQRGLSMLVIGLACGWPIASPIIAAAAGPAAAAVPNARVRTRSPHHSGSSTTESLPSSRRESSGPMSGS